MHARTARTSRDVSQIAVDAIGRVRSELEKVAGTLRADGIPVPPLEGKLLRPLLAYSFTPAGLRSRLDERFWFGALAIQMVHEASLIHDDILDDAVERRGAETVFAAQGVGPALVLGDHYLTAAYRAAARTRSSDFMDRFVTAVERTVAGEVEQAKRRGTRLSEDEYESIVRGKSGELLGAAACLGACVAGLDQVDARVALGKEIGALYQRVDDLLDYCVEADTGKTPLQDYRQVKWTWVLDVAGISGFELTDPELLDAIFAPGADGIVPADAALTILRSKKSELTRKAEELGADALVSHTLESWVNAAVDGVAMVAYSVEPPAVPGWAAEIAGLTSTARNRTSAEAIVVRTALEIGGPEKWAAYFGKHARTFSLAARLFPQRAAEQIQGLYAYCRLTDDLVDEPDDGAAPDVLLDRLAVWRDMSRHVYDGEPIGIPVLDYVMSQAAEAGVDWRYPDALLEGVGMDLTKNRYETWFELERYTFGVAGAVGGWMTQLFGIQDPDTLERAHSLGHGMQLTNILRDVGEDIARDRVYLPWTLLESYGLSVDLLAELSATDEPLPVEYRAAMEELIAAAEDYYEHARPGMEVLPAFFRRPVAAAAEAYRGIHEEVRRNDYDNLRRRAYTSLGRKLVLGFTGILHSRPEAERPSQAVARYAT